MAALGDRLATIICAMEIRYRNTRSDFKALYDDLMRDRKAAQRSDYYHSVFWCITVLTLASYVAIKNGEIFATCVFAALGGFYLKQNWSFARRWEAAADFYAATSPECSCTLFIDGHGLIERSSDIELKVPWSIVHEYAIRDERLLIHFLQYRAFAIPLHHLTASQREELIKTLAQNKVRERA